MAQTRNGSFFRRSLPSLGYVAHSLWYAALLGLIVSVACTPASQSIRAEARSNTGVAPAADAKLALRRSALRARLSALASETWAFWQKHGPDPEYGGFYGNLDRTGQKSAPTDKGLIQQARHLWTVSMWYENKQPTPEVRALADNLYRFLIGHFYDPSSKEFYFKVSEAGAVVEPKKVLYAEGFAIYALSEYARVFKVPEALRYALACFSAIDARAHDAEFGGYDQTRDPAWLSPGAQKETNTHIHLMESFAALYATSHDATVRDRLEELVRVVTEKILQKDGYDRKEFLRDWTPFGEPVVSYGHDIETNWLLSEAAEVLGRPDDPKILAAARSMGQSSAAWGFDHEHGGYFEEGVPSGAPTKLEKIWWIQAEALPGLWNLYKLTRDSTYLDRLEATLTWIEEHQRDKAHGEWFWGVLPDGSIGPHGDHKGEEWKASYHTLRALVFTEKWIDR